MLLGFKEKDYKTMARLNPPLTDAEIHEYEDNLEASYFAKRKFRVDFVKPWAGFPFNIEARDYFVRHLLRDFTGGGYRSSGVPARSHVVAFFVLQTSHTLLKLLWFLWEVIIYNTMAITRVVEILCIL